MRSGVLSDPELILIRHGELLRMKVVWLIEMLEQCGGAVEEWEVTTKVDTGGAEGEVDGCLEGQALKDDADGGGQDERGSCCRHESQRQGD